MLGMTQPVGTHEGLELCFAKERAQSSLCGLCLCQAACCSRPDHLQALCQGFTQPNGTSALYALPMLVLLTDPPLRITQVQHYLESVQRCGAKRGQCPEQKGPGAGRIALQASPQESQPPNDASKPEVLIYLTKSLVRCSNGAALPPVGWPGQ